MIKSAAILLLALSVTIGAKAGPVTLFTYAGVIDTYSVATAGYYQITVFGGQGGTGFSGGIGGLGAEIRGTFHFALDDSLAILVGGSGAAGTSTSGGHGGGGGGGGIFVVLGATPLVIAEARLVEECRALTVRFSVGRDKLKRLGFDAQTRNINGLPYAESGPIIGSAISVADQYLRTIRTKAPDECVAIGQEGLRKVNAILKPLEGGN